jgi:hypothetical protein
MSHRGMVGSITKRMLRPLFAPVAAHSRTDGRIDPGHDVTEPTVIRRWRAVR